MATAVAPRRPDTRVKEFVFLWEGVDRNNKPIAINRSSFRVDIVPQQLENAPAVLALLTQLLALNADDLDRMAELMANKDFMRFSMGPMTHEQTKSFLDKVIGWDRDRMPSQFAMIVRSSERLAGYCGFFHHEVDGKMEIEIGYRLDSAFWNRGLASEAARTVRDHGFRDLKLDYVISLIHPENHPSRRVAEKNGMILERETTFRGFPTFVFAITRERWLQLGCGAE